MFNKQRQLANIITLTRILGVGFIFWWTPYTTNFWLLLTVSIYTLICITDFLDGWIARKFHMVTKVGQVLDPLADKILVLVFLPLLEMQVITSFPVFIILSREFAIMALRIMAAREGNQNISAKFSGKLKTILTMPVCGILLGRVPVETVETLPYWMVPIEYLRLWVMSWPNWVVSFLVYLVVVVTVWSFLDYFWRFIWQQYVIKFGGDEVAAKKSMRMLIPNTFTVLNLCCGLVAVVAAWFDFFHLAVLLVILGILLDAFDGSIARKLDVQSQFGASLDSKADFISFGVAPAVVIYKRLSLTLVDGWAWVPFVLGFLYYVSVHYRLWRFNKGGHSDYFEGLPSPSGALLIVLAAISVFLSEFWIYVGIIVVVSFLMASRFPYPHFNIANKKRFFRALKVPGIIFTILTILKLLDLPYAQQVYAYEILFFLTSLYMLSPFGSLFKRVSKS
ncbi:CDP-diacylglycerol--glycerol-3-phosphate 3-phosphatidyltransferase [Candidatus Marinamargulisbacteria bacterium SCGC AG-439-L15]|nr:CDP-diacylglycerol--glycerol-3-phosphate 3-phosphatidyltransferase [Candidatus Marinamargulisbacteria bacterium SCGC AG-439-L15]